MKQPVMRRAFSMRRYKDNRGDAPKGGPRGPRPEWRDMDYYCISYMNYSGADQCEFYKAIGKGPCQRCELPKERR